MNATPASLAIPDARQPAADLLRATMTFGFLGILTPLWVYAELPIQRSGEPVAWFGLLLTLYCALRLSSFAFQGTPRLLATCFFVFVYVWGGLCAFAQNLVWTFPWTVKHTPAEAEAGLAMIVLMVVFYEIGQLTARARPRKADGVTLRFEISHSALTWVTVGAFALMLLSILMLGGPKILFTTRAAFDAIAAASGSKATMLMSVALLRSPIFVAFALILVVIVRGWRTMTRKQKRAYLGLLLLTGVGNLLANFPLSLARYWLGTIVLTLLFSLAPWRRMMPMALACGLVGMMLFIYPISDAFRNAWSADISVVERQLQTKAIDTLLNKGDFDVYQMTINGLVVSDYRGHTLGGNLIGAALFWVPRAIWPGKPFGTGWIIGYNLGYTMINLSAPLWLEFYWAFGWLGTALLGWAFSHYSGRLDLAYRRSVERGEQQNLIQVLVPFLAAYQFITLRGDLLNVVALISVAIVAFLCAVRVSRVPATTDG